MLDIDLFRTNMEIIRESQRRRFASVEVVDEIIKLDKEWRQGQYQLDCIRQKVNKEVGKLKICDADVSEQIKHIEIIKQDSTDKEAKVCEAFATLKAKLATVGNLVHDSVPNGNDEANNVVIKVCGEMRVASPGQKQNNHVDLVEFLDDVDTKRV